MSDGKYNKVLFDKTIFDARRLVQPIVE